MAKKQQLTTYSNRFFVRRQDNFYVYRAVGLSEIGRNVQYNWLKDNYDDIYAYYESRFSVYVDDMLTGFLEAANTQEEIDDVT